MALDLTILYRGPLSSCNYDCHYCPFAKKHETATELRIDRQALLRLTEWIKAHHHIRLSLLFTPWGEGLTRRWYRDAITTLSHLPHVAKVSIQTNLSCRTDWLQHCDVKRVGLWCTWHPEQVERQEFLAKCRQLDKLDVRYSVGVVGLNEYFPQVTCLRSELSPDVYLWVNALKDRGEYYSRRDVARWRGIDPLFEINNRRHPSLGRSCHTGKSVISVDGDGTMRRCHFIKAPIGNLYRPDFESALQERACTNATCGCHIGYVHLDQLGLYATFGEGVLERIPAQPIWQEIDRVAR
jgi:hypothetical protein